MDNCLRIILVSKIMGLIVVLGTQLSLPCLAVNDQTSVKSQEQALSLQRQRTDREQKATIYNTSCGSGSVFYEKGDYQNALVQFDLALVAMPDETLASIGLAKTLAKLGRVPEAVAQLNKAIEKSKDEPACYAAKIDIQFEQKQYDEALATCEQSSEAYDDNGKYYEQKVRILQAKHNLEAAKQAALAGYWHCLRNGLAMRKMEKLLEATGTAIPTDMPENRDKNDSVIRLVKELVDSNQPLSDRELQAILPFSYTPDGNMDGWYSRTNLNTVEFPDVSLRKMPLDKMVSFALEGSGWLIVKVNPDLTFITKQDLESIIGPLEVEFDPIQKHEFQVEPERAPCWVKQMKNGTLFFSFTLHEPQQLNQIQLTWKSNSCDLPPGFPDLSTILSTSEAQLEKHQFQNAIDSIMSHWQDYYCPEKPSNELKAQLLRTRRVLTRAYQGLGNKNVVIYLQAVPVAYLQQDIIAFRRIHRLPTVREYSAHKWKANGSVFASHKEVGEYHIWLDTYPIIKIPRQSPIFNNLFNQIGYLDNQPGNTAINIDALSTEQADSEYAQVYQ
jgi:tetratricopeptide (TPR) repeat protein